MNAHVDGRSAGAALRPLSNLQIKTLIQMARETFRQLCESGALGESAEFDAWRHQQCMLTVERPGLTKCRNEDFLPLMAHFLRLQGRMDEADVVVQRQEVEPRTWALATLQKACSDAADVMPRAWDYAAGFIRNKRHVAIDDADNKAIMHAAYVVARKAKQLRGQRAEVGDQK